MTAPASLTVTPASPVEGGGILFSVTGEADVAIDAKMAPAQIVVTNDASKVVARSPIFELNKLDGTTSEVVSLAVADATDGTFTLTATQKVFVDYRRGYVDVDLGTTEAIAHDATAVEVLAACVAAWGDGNIAATGGPLGTDPVVLTFGGALAGAEIAVETTDTLTGEGAAATATESTKGNVVTQGLLPGGPYVWGPIQLFADTYSADVQYAYADDPTFAYDYGYPDETAATPTEGSIIAAPVSFTVTTS